MCKKGMIRRKSYTRKDGVYVKSTCVKDIGNKGKGQSVIPTLHSGDLVKYGYSLKSMSQPRHKALNKSVKAYGKGRLIKKLNALRVLHKNTNKVYSNKAYNDIKYVQKHL